MELNICVTHILKHLQRLTNAHYLSNGIKKDWKIHFLITAFKAHNHTQVDVCWGSVNTTAYYNLNNEENVTVLNTDTIL